MRITSSSSPRPRVPGGLPHSPPARVSSGILARRSAQFLARCLALGLLLLNVTLSASAGPNPQPQSPILSPPDLNLSTPLPDFSGIRDVERRKQAFFEYLLPMIHHANHQLMQIRAQLQILRGRVASRSLTMSDALWLALLAEHYRVPVEQGYDDRFFRKMLRRIDVIPPSLVLAQAANESGWGTSRFAREGNNLFGEYCFTTGCGMIPLERPDGRQFEVARFDSVYESIQSYLINLNRHDSYLGLRKFREQARQAQEALDGTRLARGLSRYSERGADYIRDIRAMIQHNDLARYDEVAYGAPPTTVEQVATHRPSP